VRAVDGVSFKVSRGRTLALVGESGCARVVTRSIGAAADPPARQIVGAPSGLYREKASRRSRCWRERQLAALYELRRSGGVDLPGGHRSLSPVHTIGNQILEAIRIHQKVSKKGREASARRMLERVGIKDPELCLRQYPHELSGGMRQRPSSPWRW
jgi:peptide/nickel transport system ATP-binding protein